MRYVRTPDIDGMILTLLLRTLDFIGQRESRSNLAHPCLFFTLLAASGRMAIARSRQKRRSAATM
jgi:hypothetical protein